MTTIYNTKNISYKARLKIYHLDRLTLVIMFFSFLIFSPIQANDSPSCSGEDEEIQTLSKKRSLKEKEIEDKDTSSSYKKAKYHEKKEEENEEAEEDDCRSLTLTSSCKEEFNELLKNLKEEGYIKPQVEWDHNFDKHYSTRKLTLSKNKRAYQGKQYLHSITIEDLTEYSQDLTRVIWHPFDDDASPKSIKEETYSIIDPINREIIETVVRKIGVLHTSQIIYSPDIEAIKYNMDTTFSGRLQEITKYKRGNGTEYPKAGSNYLPVSLIATHTNKFVEGEKAHHPVFKLTYQLSVGDKEQVFANEYISTFHRYSHKKKLIDWHSDYKNQKSYPVYQIFFKVPVGFGNIQTYKKTVDERWVDASSGRDFELTYIQRPWLDKLPVIGPIIDALSPKKELMPPEDTKKIGKSKRK